MAECVGCDDDRGKSDYGWGAVIIISGRSESEGDGPAGDWEH